MFNHELVIQSQNRPAARPASYEQLLTVPISDNPNDTESYQYWERDHALKIRFYVGGLLWCLSQLKIDSTALHRDYAARACEAIKDETNWHEMPFSNGAWTQALARNKCNRAFRGGALQFHKAATIIVACELAVQDKIDSGQTFQEMKSGKDVYKRMSIIPACWNINDFDRNVLSDYIKSVPNAEIALLNGSGQTSRDLLRDLSSGHTVLRTTADSIYRKIVSHPEFKTRIQGVRARPGAILGRQNASEHEELNRG